MQAVRTLHARLLVSRASFLGLLVLSVGLCACSTQTEVTVDASVGDAGSEPEDWTWVDVPEAHCADGTSTGFSFSRSPADVRRLVIYLEGGGACFNERTCDSIQRGYGRAQFEGWLPVLRAFAIFNRLPAANPFGDWSFVDVPYCTGDVHAGTNPDGYGGLEQVGYLNVEHDLARIVTMFPNLEMVVLAGSSAGGFGVLVNYEQVQRAFGDVPVHALDDSGPVMGDSHLGLCLQQRMRTLWQPPFPADCTECNQPDGGGLSAIWGYLGARYPDRRFALLSTTQDAVIRSFYGYGLSADCETSAMMSGDAFEAGVLELRDDIISPYPNVRAFLFPGEAHTMLLSSWTYWQTGAGPNLGEWVQSLTDGDPSWSNVGP
jgi:hypothetical protein